MNPVRKEATGITTVIQTNKMSGTRFIAMVFVRSGEFGVYFEGKGIMT